VLGVGSPAVGLVFVGLLVLDGVELVFGDSVGVDITGLESGAGVGVDVAFVFGLVVWSSAHGLVVGEALAGVAVAVGDESGLEGAVGEPVGLAVPDTVALAVADVVGAGDVVLEGELAGEPEGVDDGDLDGAGGQDAAGTTAAGCDGAWVRVAAVLAPPLTGAALGTG
jgi:hypothetical protein